MIDDGTLIIGGRLLHSRLPYRVKHPVILPPSHRVSKMIVLDSHNGAHLGVEWTLSRIRGKYWIVNARSKVSSGNV